MTSERVELQLFAGIAVFAGMIAWLVTGRFARGTTLRAPWCWAALALLLVGVGVISGVDEPFGAYFFGSATLLPAVAVMGAKRPQDRGWQLIVGVLWLTLLWPVGEAYLLGHAWNLHRQPLRAWFTFILVAMQLANWSVTRLAPAAFLIGVGQFCLLQPVWAWGDGTVDQTRWLSGVCCCACGMIAGVLIWRKLEQPPAAGEDSFHRCWIDFRDLYGVIWALRVQERINEVARLQQWPRRLNWTGWTAVTTDPPTGQLPDEAAIADSLRRTTANTWRRFVSADWAKRRGAVEYFGGDQVDLE